MKSDNSLKKLIVLKKLKGNGSMNGGGKMLFLNGGSVIRVKIKIQIMLWCLAFC